MKPVTHQNFTASKSVKTIIYVTFTLVQFGMFSSNKYDKNG